MAASISAKALNVESFFFSSFVAAGIFVIDDIYGLLSCIDARDARESF
jgi:hypothetical protein